MAIDGKNVGFALTGSYCTFDKVFIELEKLAKEKANIYPIFSERSKSTDTRFGKAEDFLKRAEEITLKAPVTSIVEAEKFGPGNFLDIMVIAPCSGNTIAKLAYGITDSPVLMAVKGHLRNCKPVVIAVSTNDALTSNLKNIGLLMNMKNLFFVPFGQDNYRSKPFSMVADFELILPTIEEALLGKQIQPIMISPR